eukprot:CAMPEP_0114559896 /NCGR_PEP_ID=MMETSP0114-20121206/11167_1 /TAXON_ID=31324 /ORGANISM="Goniomonas sp, Strain m" /LENGTH=601 /DNA_ID=CAMNT_0001745399 /DNA_START=63 /DNA_END=1868 /DNA_ORIENTATION=+
MEEITQQVSKLVQRTVKRANLQLRAVDFDVHTRAASVQSCVGELPTECPNIFSLMSEFRRVIQNSDNPWVMMRDQCASNCFIRMIEAMKVCQAVPLTERKTYLIMADVICSSDCGDSTEEFMTASLGMDRCEDNPPPAPCAQPLAPCTSTAARTTTVPMTTTYANTTPGNTTTEPPTTSTLAPTTTTTTLAPTTTPAPTTTSATTTAFNTTTGPPPTTSTSFPTTTVPMTSTPPGQLVGSTRQFCDNCCLHRLVTAVYSMSGVCLQRLAGALHSSSGRAQKWMCEIGNIAHVTPLICAPEVVRCGTAMEETAKYMHGYCPPGPPSNWTYGSCTPACVASVLRAQGPLGVEPCCLRTLEDRLREAETANQQFRRHCWAYVDPAQVFLLGNDGKEVDQLRSKCAEAGIDLRPPCTAQSYLKAHTCTMEARASVRLTFSDDYAKYKNDPVARTALAQQITWAASDVTGLSEKQVQVRGLMAGSTIVDVAVTHNANSRKDVAALALLVRTNAATIGSKFQQWMGRVGVTVDREKTTASPVTSRWVPTPQADGGAIMVAAGLSPEQARQSAALTPSQVEASTAHHTALPLLTLVVALFVSVASLLS